jgi:hypothetical protein
MIELIELYEVQKEKYQPIISQFERELAYYIGSDLSEFKLHIPNFRNYLNSDNFKTKFSTALRDFRVSIERSKISDGQTGKDVTTVNAENQCKPLTAGDFAALLTQFLDNIAKDEITLPNIALVEILYSLANPNNFRLKRQEALNKQIFVRLSNQPQTKVLESDMPLCNCINGFCTMGDLWMVVVKDEFNETDLQYPLLLSLALSHTSPRHVKTFLDKQPPHYKGDFTKVLETAILEYDDLLLNSQVKEAYQWLSAYKPVIECETVIAEDVAAFETVEFETVETDSIVATETQKTSEPKPIIDIHSLYVDDVFEVLKGYFNLSDYANLLTLLSGQSIEGKIYFRGKGASLFCGFRDLWDAKIILSVKAEMVRWLVTYISADNQKGEKKSPLILDTVERYFEGDKKKSHNRVNFDEIIEKKRKK